MADITVFITPFLCARTKLFAFWFTLKHLWFILYVYIEIK